MSGYCGNISRHSTLATVSKHSVSQQFHYKRVSFDGGILFVHCHKLYVLRKNLCISKVEEKFKFPLVCTMWCQFGWSRL